MNHFPRARSYLQTAMLVALPMFANAQSNEVHITVQAGQAIGPVSRLLTGACIEDVNHEIYGGLYSQMIFGESFQEPPPTPGIDGFKTYDGDWNLRDGVLSINGQDGPKLISQHESFKDGTVAVDIMFPDRKGENAGLILCVNQPGSGADSFIGYEVSLDPVRQVLRLARHRNNYDLVMDVPCAVPVEKWIALEAKISGSKIELFVNGKSVINHKEGADALNAGRIGLRAWHCQVSYRRLRVTIGKTVEELPFVQSEQSPAPSAMWRMVRCGSAAGHFATATNGPFVGVQSQQMILESGQGEWGIENQGLNHWGMNFEKGRAYEGRVWARAEKPVKLYAALESADGSQVYAETPLEVSSNDWQRLEFTLTPNADDTSGGFVLKLKDPGDVTFGYAFLQPGIWGRFKGLPVRRDVAEGLIAQGITVLRYGGSMVNAPGYRWKNMFGPRDLRPPYPGTWYRYSTDGWGIPDFMNFCEAAGFEYVPDFNVNETPADMTDFIEYAKASSDTEWGRRRVADGHPAPYHLHYIELGNEERVDDDYADKFEALAKAIWAKDKDLILVVGDFAYTRRITDPFHFDGADSHITSLEAQQRILKFAKQRGQEVWFDLHVGTDGPEPASSLDGMFSYIDALEHIGDGAKFKVVVFELNAGNHSQKRALANALAIGAVERDGRLPIVTSANCLQPDGQNDNDWDQGLLFLNPSQVWLQPPGYVTRMISEDYQPRCVRSSVSGGDGKISVVATSSEDGRKLVLQVVNLGNPVTASIELKGFTPKEPAASVTELAAPLNSFNTADDMDHVKPRTTTWENDLSSGRMNRKFVAHSFTIIKFE